ncbi:MAG: hypothetical protein QOI41_976 [Myxococcales bacterium]|nr:hypothetical protein [Myxococcales bacterium]
MCRLHAAALLVTLLTACSKPDTSTAPTASAVAVPTEAPTIAITGTPVAPSASALASASASAPAPASASAPAKPAPSAKGVTTTTAASGTTATTAPPVALKPASSRLSGKNFVLDAASPGCRVDTPCTMTLHITAAGDYHVNKEYPYKFIAAAAPGVQFLGSADANTFSRATGDFRDDGEKAATLTVRFKPTAAGEARVSGTYKMSVCSAENCQIETPTVTLAVPVM